MSDLFFGIVLAIFSFFGGVYNQTLGAFGDPFFSRQLATTTLTVGTVLSNQGTYPTWITCATLTGSADLCDGSDGGGSGGSGNTTWELSANGLTGFLAPTTTQKVWIGQASSTIFSAHIGHFGYLVGTTTATSTLAGSLSIAGRLNLAAPASNCEGNSLLATNGTGFVYCDVDAGATVGTGGTGVTTFGGTNTVLYTTAADTLSSEAAFTYAPSTNLLTANYASTTAISGAALNITAEVDFDYLTSALLLAGSTGLISEYTGIDCTNQFVRDVSAAGAGTCATIVAADVDLADLTATDSTLTFSGAYDGQTARTVGLNLANANTWTALQTFTLHGSPGIIANALVGIGTSTPKWALTIASSTGPQLTLTDGSSTAAPWNLRSIAGNLFFSTSSPSTFATTSPAAFTLLGTGVAGLNIGTTSSISSATTTIFMQKLQIQGLNSAGAQVCGYVNNANAWTFAAGPCP